MLRIYLSVFNNPKFITSRRWIRVFVKPYLVAFFCRASGTITVKALRTPFEKRKRLKEEKKELQNRQAALLELIKEEKREKRRRREQAKAAKADNQKRAAIVQVVTNQTTLQPLLLLHFIFACPTQISDTRKIKKML